MTRLSDRSTTIRVATFATSTCPAATQAVTPFGRLGIWTRYDLGLQPASTSAPRIEKIVGTRLTFSLRKPAKARVPGRRETVARERTIAAYASRGEPSRWKEPSAQVPEPAAMSALTSGRFSVPPQPARRVRPSAGMMAKARTGGRRVSPLMRGEGPVNICRQQFATTERLITLRKRNDASQAQAHRDHHSCDPAARRSSVPRGAEGLLEEKTIKRAVA